MDRLNEINLGWLYLGLIAAGAVGAFAWRSIRRAVRKVDQILHTGPPVPETTPADYGPAGLQRLQAAINDTREEDQP